MEEYAEANDVPKIRSRPINEMTSGVHQRTISNPYETSYVDEVDAPELMELLDDLDITRFSSDLGRNNDLFVKRRLESPLPRLTRKRFIDL